jgi:hypothetical protein
MKPKQHGIINELFPGVSAEVNAVFRYRNGILDEYFLKKKDNKAILYEFSNIVVFNDIRAVSMPVCWHHLLFQFSNFEFSNLAIFTFTRQIDKFKFLFIISDKKCSLIRIPRMTSFNHVLHYVEY